MPLRRRFKDKYDGSLRERIYCLNYVRLFFFFTAAEKAIIIPFEIRSHFLQWIPHLYFFFSLSLLFILPNLFSSFSFLLFVSAKVAEFPLSHLLALIQFLTIFSCRHFLGNPRFCRCQTFSGGPSFSIK